jgi:hypothetical protein
MSNVSLAGRSAGTSSDTIATHKDKNGRDFLMVPPFADGLYRDLERQIQIIFGRKTVT